MYSTVLETNLTFLLWLGTQKHKSFEKDKKKGI